MTGSTTGYQNDRICMVFCLLLLFARSAIGAEGVDMTATELLATFSGGDASQHESVFQYTYAGRIVGVDIQAVGNNATVARYSGHDEPWYEVNNILHIATADGHHGVSGVDTYYRGGFSDDHLQALQDVAADLVKLGSLDPVVVGNTLLQIRPELSDEVRASIDIALWDLAARKAGISLHRLLGSQRQTIEPYASLPFYETLPEYLAAVEEYAEYGYTRFKFHIWGDIEKDLQLVKLVQSTYADSSYRFMVDLESMYDLADARRLGQQMDVGLFLWVEAPIDDTLLQQYALLRDELDVLLIPAGYNIYSEEFIREGMTAGAWDAVRFDATVVGGIAAALKLLVIANEMGVPVDIQSWGHSLAQAANLHLMLANERTPFFEAPMPKAAFEFGMINGDLLDAGMVVVPDGPGLGMTVDQERLSGADFHAHIELDYSGVQE